MLVDHWMLFSTFAEQRYFEYPKIGAYKGVIVNGNMAVHAPAGMAGFLLEKTSTNMQYIVDPLTHAFQHDPELICGNDGEPKASIRGLADAYGEPIVSALGHRPLLPKHLADDSVLRDFVHNCIDFQATHLANYMIASDAAKYFDEDEAAKPPYAVVSPYFYITESTIDGWLPIMVRAAQIAREYISEDVPYKLFGAIVVSQGVMADEGLSRGVADALGPLGLDGFLLWIDNFDEQSASRAELHGLIRFGRMLRGQERREVINLHGGYFSVLAAGNLGDGALSGVTHAPEFGEYRSVVPVGGGIPIAKYYVPGLHSRVRYRDTVRIFGSMGWLTSADQFHSEVCACPECTRVIDNNIENYQLFGEGIVKRVRRRHGLVRIEFPTSEAKKRCLKHYLQCKYNEYHAASEAPARTLINNLSDGEDKYAEAVGLEGVSHLHLWRDVFNKTM